MTECFYPGCKDRHLWEVGQAGSDTHRVACLEHVGHAIARDVISTVAAGSPRPDAFTVRKQP